MDGDEGVSHMVRPGLAMRLLPLLTLVSFLGGPAAPCGQMQDDRWKVCRSEDPDLSIRACSALIQSAKPKDSNLAAAFYNRGVAYAHKGEYDIAIENYSQALLLNPILPDAFYGRGL